MRVFVAGASGVVGRRLVPRLVDRGPRGRRDDARTPEKLEALRALGADAVVMDGLDAASVGEAVARGRAGGGHPPDDGARRDVATCAGSTRSSRSPTSCGPRPRPPARPPREAVGVRRFVAQSYTGWPNERAGGPVKTESDPLDPDRRHSSGGRSRRSAISSGP